MPIEYVKGDLFAPENTAHTKCIAHGCNAQGVMGKGFALLVKNNFPKAFKDYYSTYVMRKDRGITPLPLGMVIKSKCGHKDRQWSIDRIIFNCITQDQFAPTHSKTDTRRYVSYDAVAEAFDTISCDPDARTHGLAIPKIGAGLAHGSWPVIAAIIESCAPNLAVTCYVPE